MKRNSEKNVEVMIDKHCFSNAGDCQCKCQQQAIPYSTKSLRALYDHPADLLRKPFAIQALLASGLLRAPVLYLRARWHPLGSELTNAHFEGCKHVTESTSTVTDFSLKVRYEIGKEGGGEMRDMALWDREYFYNGFAPKQCLFLSSDS